MVENNQGEGDREAARHYREKTEAYVKSGQVDQAANNAANMSEQERKQAEAAEKAGTERAKEFDPQTERDYSEPTK